MRNLKHNPIGIYEKAMPPFTAWSELLDSTRAYGYDFLELSVDESDERLTRLEWTSAQRNEVRAAIRTTGVPVRHLCLSGHRRFPFASADPATRTRAWEMYERALELCVDLNIRTIQTQGHDVYYERSTALTQERYRESMNKVAELARQASVMIGFENADVDSFGSADQSVSMIESIANPWFQFYPDIGNIVGHGHSLASQIRRGIGHTVAVHVKDARPGEFRRVPFGEGIVPFREAFETLQELDYRGPFVVEMWNDGVDRDRTMARDALVWLQERMDESAADPSL